MQLFFRQYFQEENSQYSFYQQQNKTMIFSGEGQNQVTSPRGVYQLAVCLPNFKRNHSTPIQRSPSNFLKPPPNILKRGNMSKLPSIIPQQSNLREYGETRNDILSNNQMTPKRNIFHQQHPQKLSVNDLKNFQPYKIVGRKEIQSYNARSNKKKLMTKRTQSAMSISKHSSTVKSQIINQYLTKDDILATLNPALPNTIQNVNQNTEMQKIKKKLLLYKKIWQKQKNQYNYNYNGMRASKLGENSKVIQNISKTQIIRKPLIDLVDEHREKIQKKQTLTLKQQKQNTSQRLWPNTLRQQYDLNGIYSHFESSKILRNQNKMQVKGKDKLQKELIWINDKGNRNHVFNCIDKPLDKRIVDQIYMQDSKDTSLAQSIR